MRLVTAPISNYAFFTALGFAAAGGQYQCAAETGVVWSNANGTPGATKDIGLWRNAAGILEVNNASDKRVALRINTTQSSFDVVFDGVRRAQFGMGFRLGADCGFAWASNAAGNNSDNPLDTGFTRNAAGVIEINNGTPGQYRDLIARNITGSGGGVMGSYLRSFGSLQVDGYIFVPWQGPVTIAGGVVNFSGMNRTYDTEGGTATDDLDTINSGGDGVFMLLHAANDAHTIVVKHNTGNILLNGGVDFVLDNAADMLLLMYKGAISKWVQIASSNNGA
jgi:hypothetical protein